MSIVLSVKSSKDEWRGSNELARRSIVWSAVPCLRIFGRMIPLGAEQVVVELISEERGPTACVPEPPTQPALDLPRR